MKMFDKLKDLFTDEIEEEVEEEPVKKEVIQVEIPAPQGRVQYEEEPVAKEETTPFFDDVDFEDIKRSNPTLEEIYEEEPFVEPAKPVYSYKKEEKKHFEPTPIISPVYGVLDKNYKKDDIVNKAEPPKTNRDITIDDVRNKAYGTLEDELESTLFGKTSIMFQNVDREEELNKIEKDLESTADAIDLLSDEVPSKHAKKELLEDEILNEVPEDKEEIKEEKENISDNDLFNLIDDMYGEGK